MDEIGFRVFQHVKWSPERGDLRRFALSMIVGFAVMGGLVTVRRQAVEPAAIVLWASGLALALGALTPALGRFVYLAVQVPSTLIGFVVSRVILTSIFAGLFTPLGLGLRLAGRDPLRLKLPGRQSQWIACQSERRSDSYYRQS